LKKKVKIALYGSAGAIFAAGGAASGSFAALHLAALVYVFSITSNPSKEKELAKLIQVICSAYLVPAVIVSSGVCAINTLIAKFFIKKTRKAINDLKNQR